MVCQINEFPLGRKIMRLDTEKSMRPNFLPQISQSFSVFGGVLKKGPMKFQKVRQPTSIGQQRAIGAGVELMIGKEIL